MNAVRSNNVSLKYQRFTSSGYKVIGFTKIEFVAKSQFLSEGFNIFFANIGPDLAKTIKGTKKHFSDFLSQGTVENFVFANMTPDIINDALKKLKSKNSSGPDKISTNLLKSIIPIIMGPICHLFDLSFKTGFIIFCSKLA